MIAVDWVTISGAINYIIHDGVFWLLMVLIIMDVITGTGKAISFRVMNSSVGINGMIKHTIILLLTVLMGVVSFIVNIPMLAYIFIAFYIFEYILSILENLEALGVEFPDGLRKVILTMKNKNDKRWDDYDS